jgi:hypothetical protein
MNITIFISIIIIIVIIISIYNYFNTYKHNTYTHVLGCRKPNTKLGSWSGAYVFVKDIHNNMRMAVFEDGMDFVGYPRSIDHAKEIYNNFINEHKWIKMSNDDIYKTSGIKISHFTKTNL